MDREGGRCRWEGGRCRWGWEGGVGGGWKGGVDGGGCGGWEVPAG